MIKTKEFSKLLPWGEEASGNSGVHEELALWHRVALRPCPPLLPGRAVGGWPLCAATDPTACGGVSRF